ncbi:MAG: uracil-DNA glycosylase [Actinobacteria bacterium]|nr:uracil-DNA glycosylase [Actinomycetota bacterium]
MDRDVLSSEKREKLKDFYFRIRDCRECGLSSTRINFVFGSGNSNARIVLIGEAPGKNEDLQGKPFVGQAGKLLDELLQSIGFTRSDVFIANVLKCRPPENRDPNIGEIDSCKKYLFKQIEIIDPEIICTMGRYSTQLIIGTPTGINKLRGKVFKINSRIIIPINHPAAALYTPSRFQILREDFNRLKTVFDNIGKPETAIKIEEAGVLEENIKSGMVSSKGNFMKQQQKEGTKFGHSGDMQSKQEEGSHPGQQDSRQLGLF